MPIDRKKLSQAASLTCSLASVPMRRAVFLSESLVFVETCWIRLQWIWGKDAHLFSSRRSSWAVFVMHPWELDMILNGMLDSDYFHFLFHHHRSLGWEEAIISPFLTVVSGPTWPWPAPSSMRCSSARSGTKRTGSASVEWPEALP